MNLPSIHITSIEAGVPIKVLTGLHSGCLELIAKESVHTITDLRGKRVGVDGLNSHPHMLTEPRWPPMSGSIPSTISNGS